MQSLSANIDNISCSATDKTRMISSSFLKEESPLPSATIQWTFIGAFSGLLHGSVKCLLCRLTYVSDSKSKLESMDCLKAVAFRLPNDNPVMAKIYEGSEDQFQTPTESDENELKTNVLAVLSQRDADQGGGQRFDLMAKFLIEARKELTSLSLKLF